MPRETSLTAAVENYILFHDLAAGTRDWYRRIAGVFCKWAGGDVPIDRFSGEQISRLLADKLAEGRSPHYLKSLRNGLAAVLRDVKGGAIDRIRTIRTPPLEPEAWSADEVAKALADDKDASETLDRTLQHLRDNNVDPQATKITLGPKLTLAGKEVFSGPHAEEANKHLSRDYRAPFIVPATEDL